MDIDPIDFDNFKPWNYIPKVRDKFEAVEKETPPAKPLKHPTRVPEGAECSGQSCKGKPQFFCPCNR